MFRIKLIKFYLELYNFLDFLEQRKGFFQSICKLSHGLRGHTLITCPLSLPHLLFCNYFRGLRSGWGFGSCTNVSKVSPQSWISLLVWRIQLFVWTSNASQSVCFWIPEFEPDDTWKICQKNSSKNLSKKFVKNFVKRVFY